MAKPAPETTAFVRGLNDKIAGYTFGVEPGRRFDKIVQRAMGGEQRSVHAFVDRATGALIKPATWKAPQKNADGSLSVRYDLSNPRDFQIAINAAEFSGGYLYKQ